MDTRGIDQLLGELRTMSALAANESPVVGNLPEGADFAALLQTSLAQVSQLQAHAQQKQQAMEAGAADINLQDVMISLQKASLSFQTMVQVRNKLVTAYQEVMNMQV